MIMDGKVLLTRTERLKRVNDQYIDLPDLHLLRSRNRFIAGRGSEKPRVMFIGDVPGGDEAKTGQALAGRRKAYVLHLLRGIDLKEEHMHTTYLLKFRPPNGRDPKELETMASLPHLLEEIDVLKPNVIVTWGHAILECFAPGQTLDSTHGQHIVSDHGFMFVPMYSPDAGLANPVMHNILGKDFQTIRSLV